MNNFVKYFIGGATCGLIGAWVKTLVEPPLEKLGNEKFPPTQKQLRLKGADVVGHPENMPPAILAKRVSREVFHHQLSKEETLKIMPLIHYGIGKLTGIAYVNIARQVPWVTIGYGIPAGIVVWALSHGSTVPALGLQAPVKKMPKSWWVWEFGSHLVFGFAMEMSRRALVKYVK